MVGSVLLAGKVKKLVIKKNIVNKKAFVHGSTNAFLL